MKRQLCGFVLIGLLATGVVAAQQLNPRPGKPLPQVEAGSQDVLDMHPGDLSKKLQKRFTHMTRRYKLTADQQSRVRSILLKEQRDGQTVTADTLMSHANKQDELTELHEATQQKIGSILNQQQKHKFDSDEKTRAWMERRLPNPNPGPPNVF